MHKNLRRSVVALATAFACIGIMASPASATIDTYVITGGTIVAHNANSTQTITTTLGGTAGSSCTSTIQADVVNTGTTGTINITTFTSIGHFTLGTNHYVATITRTASTSGTWGTSSFPGTISSLGLTVRVQIRTAPNNSSTNFDCDGAGTTVLCTLVTTVHLAGTYDNGHPSTISTTAHLATTASSTISLGIGTCAVPFSTFNNGTATISSLTLHQTA